MEKYSKKDLERAFKYVKEGAILLSAKVALTNGLNNKLYMDNLQMTFDELGYRYRTLISGSTTSDGINTMDISFLFPYPNATIETFGEMVYKLQNVAEKFGFDLILYDEIESLEFMSFGRKEIAA